MSPHSFDRILVLGAGKVGRTVADLLAEQSTWQVTLADRAPPAGPCPGVAFEALDVQDGPALARLLGRHQAVINALPFFLATHVADAAVAAGTHYLDLTEDVAATRHIQALATRAHSVLMPQCGLAPGVIGLLGAAMAREFEVLHTLRLRVGALPRQACNALRYNLTWSLDGLINEYSQPSEAIVQGRITRLQALEGLENLVLDGEAFEAFNTSGGLGTLCHSLQGKVQELDYKSLRYPGHRDAMHLLLHGLGLRDRPDLLRQVLEHAVPHSRDDRVIVFASATGLRHGRLEQDNRLAQLQGGLLAGTQRTAIELSTASGVVGALELLRRGLLPAKGFVGPDRIALDDFLGTRAGRYFSALASTAPSPC